MGQFSQMAPWLAPAVEEKMPISSGSVPRLKKTQLTYIAFTTFRFLFSAQIESSNEEKEEKEESNKSSSINVRIWHLSIYTLSYLLHHALLYPYSQPFALRETRLAQYLTCIIFGHPFLASGFTDSWN